MVTGINDCSGGVGGGLYGGIEVFDGAKLNGGIGGATGGLYPAELGSQIISTSSSHRIAAGSCFRADVGYGGCSESGPGDDRCLLLQPSGADDVVSHRGPIQGDCRSAALLYATNCRLQRQAIDGVQMDGGATGGGGGAGGGGTGGAGSRGDGSGSEGVAGDGAGGTNAFADAMCRSTAGAAVKSASDDNQEGAVQYQNNSETETGQSIR